MEAADLLATARACTDEAAGILRSLDPAFLEVREKSGHHDITTSADVQVEAAVVSTIRARHPDHGIVAEEGGSTLPKSPYQWYVDPIDGTTNFVRGFPFYSVSVAVALEGSMVAGVVYDPCRNEVFSAARGEGAYLGDRRLAVSNTSSIERALIATGFHYDRGESMARTLEAVRILFSRGLTGIRRTGSAALDLAFVAAGRTDAFWEHQLQSWDVAAGALLVEEAGGRVTNDVGDGLTVKADFVVASNDLLHQTMLEVVREVYPVKG